MKFRFIIMSILVLGCLCMAKNVQAADSDNIAYEHTFKSSGWNTPIHDIMTITRKSNTLFGPYMIIKNESGLGNNKLKVYISVIDEDGNLSNCMENMTGTGVLSYFDMSEGTAYKLTINPSCTMHPQIKLRFQKGFTATWGATVTGYFNPYVTN